MTIETSFISDIDLLVQESRNSSALAMELRLSCINPLAWSRTFEYIALGYSLTVFAAQFI